jgi:hypothetical protein
MKNYRNTPAEAMVSKRELEQKGYQVLKPYWSKKHQQWVIEYMHAVTPCPNCNKSLQNKPKWQICHQCGYTKSL